MVENLGIGIVAVSFFILFGTVALIAIGLYLTWLFIRSAVQSGVERGLSDYFNSSAQDHRSSF